MNKLIKIILPIILLTSNISSAEKEDKIDDPHRTYTKEEVNELFDDKLDNEVSDIMNILIGMGDKKPYQKIRIVQAVEEPEEDEDDCCYFWCNGCCMILFFAH